MAGLGAQAARLLFRDLREFAKLFHSFLTIASGRKQDKNDRSHFANKKTDSQNLRDVQGYLAGAEWSLEPVLFW